MQTSRETCTLKEKKTSTRVTPQRNNITQSGSAVSGTLGADFWATVERDGMKMLRSISPLKSSHEESRRCQWKKRRRKKRKQQGHSFTTPYTDSQLTEVSFSSYLGDCDDRPNTGGGETNKDMSCKPTSMEVTETPSKEPEPKTPRPETVKTSKLAKHKARNPGKDQQILGKEVPPNTCKQERQVKMSPESQATGNLSAAKRKSPNFQTSLEDSLNSSEQSQNRLHCKTVRGEAVNSLRVKRVKSRIALFEAKRKRHILDKQRLGENTDETEQKTGPAKTCKRDTTQCQTPTGEGLIHPHKEYLSASQLVRSTTTPVGWHIRLPLDKQSQSSGLLRRSSCARRSRVMALITKFEESAKRRTQNKQEQLSRAHPQNSSLKLMTDVDIPPKLNLDGCKNEATLRFSPTELEDREPAHKKLRYSGEESNESEVNDSLRSISSLTSNRGGIKCSTNKRTHAGFTCCAICRCSCKHSKPSTVNKAVHVSPSELSLMSAQQNRTVSLGCEDSSWKEQSAQTEPYETRKSCQMAEVSPYVVNQCDYVNSPEKQGGDSNLGLKHVEIPLESNCRSEVICQALRIKKYTSLLRRSISNEKEMQLSSSKSDNATDTESQRSLNTISSVVLSPPLPPAAKTTWGPIKFTLKSSRRSDNLRQPNRQERLFSSEDETDCEVIKARRASQAFLRKMEDDDRGEGGNGLISGVSCSSQDIDRESHSNVSIVRNDSKVQDKDANNNDEIFGKDGDKVSHSSDSESIGGSIFEMDHDKVTYDNDSHNEKEPESNDGVFGNDSKVDISDYLTGRQRGKTNSHKITDPDDDFSDDCNKDDFSDKIDQQGNDDKGESSDAFQDFDEMPCRDRHRGKKAGNLAVQTTSGHKTTATTRKTPKLNDGLLRGLGSKSTCRKSKSKPKDTLKASKSGKTPFMSEKRSQRKLLKQPEVEMQEQVAKRSSKFDYNDKVADQENTAADDNNRKSSDSGVIFERDTDKLLCDKKLKSSDTIIKNDGKIKRSDCIIGKEHSKPESNRRVESEDDLFENSDNDDFVDKIEQRVSCHKNNSDETDLDDSNRSESGVIRQHKHQNNKVTNADSKEAIYTRTSNNAEEDLADGDSADIDSKIDEQIGNQCGDTGSSDSDGMNYDVTECSTGAVKRKHRDDCSEIIDDDVISCDSCQDFAEVGRWNRHRGTKAANLAVETTNSYKTMSKSRKTHKLNDGLLRGLHSKTKCKSKSGKMPSKSGKRRKPSEQPEIEIQEEQAKENRAVCHSMVRPFPEEWEDPLIKRVRADYDVFLQRHFRRLLTELGKKRRLSDEPIKRGLNVKQSSRARREDNKSTRKLAKKVKADGWIDYEILPQIYIEPNTKSFIRKIK